MSIILHCFGESGNSYKAALTLELANLTWKPEKVDFFNGATRTSDFKSINLMGEAPVMVDGEVYDQPWSTAECWVLEGDLIARGCMRVSKTWYPGLEF